AIPGAPCAGTSKQPQVSDSYRVKFEGVLTAGPSEPTDPFSPEGPGGPAAPGSPGRPAAPVSPRAPLCPSLPVGPVGPAGPAVPWKHPEVSGQPDWRSVTLMKAMMTTDMLIFHVAPAFGDSDLTTDV
uniref:Uncharacterized protein n=1 Tax=Myripristis murdjan TaxID=586833 RepID=A0A667ZRU7_9TELE